MVHPDGQISEAGLAAFADGSLSPRRRATGLTPPPLHRLAA